MKLFNAMVAGVLAVSLFVGSLYACDYGVQAVSNGCYAQNVQQVQYVQQVAYPQRVVQFVEVPNYNVAQVRVNVHGQNLVNVQRVVVRHNVQRVVVRRGLFQRLADRRAVRVGIRANRAAVRANIRANSRVNVRVGRVVEVHAGY